VKILIPLNLLKLTLFHCTCEVHFSPKLGQKGVVKVTIEKIHIYMGRELKSESGLESQLSCSQ
jgi:hypothetical protein